MLQPYTEQSRKNAALKSALRLLTLLFVVCNGLLIIFKKKLDAWGVDTPVVIMGNLLLFIISAASVWLFNKGADQKKGHAAVRGVYGGFILKFFTLLAAAMIYFYFAKEINKPAIFICMGLYLVYNFAGVSEVVKKR